MRDADGEVWRLAYLRGTKIVLFFYPADDTPGCTTEAQDFTALLPRLEQAGAAVLGVSGGTVAAKDRFIAKAGLGVPLLADESGEVIRAYGAWGEKSMYGKTYTGLIRTTVLIDAEGRVAQAWTVSRVKGHAEKVVKAVEDLTATA